MPATEQSPVGDAGRRRAGWVAGALVALALIVGAAVRDMTPPDPVPASAPAQEFSAARAATLLPGFAGEPRPIGTRAADRARDHLLGRLRELGLTPEVQAAMAASPLRSGNDGSVLVGRVDNIVGVLPGTDSTGRVFLVAHYDSVMNSPGAADDGAAVAAILESVRALRAGPALRNDVVVVFTDGEEPGLLGAEAFVREHPLARGGGVVLNLEASGRQGPSTVFETSAGNACLIDALAAAPHPYGDSSTAAFYAMSSLNTDFTLFADAGFAGLNSAFTRGTAAYHTPQDSIANLSRASLQHHGANLLSLTRTFGAADLRGDAATGCGDSVFFSAFGTVVRYPVGLALPSAGLALLVSAILLVRRRALLTLPRTLAGFAAALLPLVLAPVAAYGLWRGLVLLRPGYADLGMGDPWRPESYRLAVVALTAAILLGWYAALRRRIGPAALALGALAWLALLGVATAIAAPGASFLVVLPTLGAALAALVAVLLPPARCGRRVAALAVGSAPTMVVLPQLVWELAASVGMGMSAVVAFLFALLALTLLPLLELAFPGHTRAAERVDPGERHRPPADRGAALTGALLVVTAGLAGAGLGIDRFDADHPRPAHAQYVLDADTGAATWVSRDRQPSQWTCRLVDCAAPRTRSIALAEAFPWLADRRVRTGEARAGALAPPDAVVLDERTEGDSRIVEIRVRSARGAPAISMYVDRPVTAATVAGLPLADITPLSKGPWVFGLEVHAPPADGVVVRLRIDAGDEVRLRIVDHSYGLDGIPGFAPRPDGVGVAMAPSDVVSVGRTQTLSAGESGRQ